MTSSFDIQPVTGKPGRLSVASGNTGTSSGFADAQKLAQADLLLKATDQYAKWQSIRQKNDETSVVLAEKIIERSRMLENAGENKPLDSAGFDALTRSIGQHGIVLSSSEQYSNNFAQAVSDSDVPELREPETFKPVIPKEISRSNVSAPVTPEDEMIVDILFGKYSLSPALIALGNEKKLLLPLGELSRILEFNIRSNPENGQASGWFLSQDRTFFLDTESGKADIQGKSVSFSPDQILATDEDIYVDAKVLSSWFPVDFSYDFVKQSVFVNPREDLPFQTRISRYQSWKNQQKPSDDYARLPLAPPDYNFIETPFVDMGLSSDYHDDGEKRAGYYLHAKGDLAWMNSELYLSGDDDERLETARLTLRREDPEGNLLGPLYATQAAVGDIRVPDFPVIGGGKYERGAKVGNIPLQKSGEYEHTFFEGNLAPGWDVEVYRNNVLIGTQRVGTDGRYSFDQVPLYYGSNEFLLKFYGPQGEVREEKKEILVGNDIHFIRCIFIETWKNNILQNNHILPYLIRLHNLKTFYLSTINIVLK